jgi:ribosomal protein S14
MKNLFFKDKLRRHLYNKVELKYSILKHISRDFTLPKQVRMKAFFLLKMLPKNSSIVRVRTRCLVTNRSRSIYKKFKVSRLVFRRLALKGSLIGVRKSS